MKNNLRQIKQINKDISDALKFWQDMLLISDADQWAYYLEYSEKDLFNALYIFNHVAQNIAIKKGFFTEENAEEKMAKFREGIKEGFGFDTIELTNKVLGKNEGK
jgi:hypothetical protein